MERHSIAYADRNVAPAAALAVATKTTTVTRGG